ncbi:MAG: KH domain RNA binding protein YlqC, partial [uncultured Acidimicrobiales bacterium]
ERRRRRRGGPRRGGRGRQPPGGLRAPDGVGVPGEGHRRRPRLGGGRGRREPQHGEPAPQRVARRHGPGHRPPGPHRPGHPHRRARRRGTRGNGRTRRHRRL